MRGKTLACLIAAGLLLGSAAPSRSAPPQPTNESKFEAELRELGWYLDNLAAAEKREASLPKDASPAEISLAHCAVADAQIALRDLYGDTSPFSDTSC